MIEPLLQIDNLSVSFQALHSRLTVIEDVSLSIGDGEVLGVVGESGSGKSVTALSIMALLGEQGRIERGSIRFDGRDLARLPEDEMRAVRGRSVSMIFQEPMTSLNPVYTVGFQIAEVLMEHLGLSEFEATARAVELMRRIGIPAAAERVHHYPHQMSGGMRQRVMIAMAMACGPKLLIADEPTTALDVTIQAQILDLMADLRRAFSAAILMITHDMGVIATVADRVIVMYAGQIVEEAPVRDLFAASRHPYTRLLLRSIPLATRKQARLEVIPGATPSPANFPLGCRFHPRCPDAIDACRQTMPVLEKAGEGRRVRCFRAFEAGLKSMTAP
jgi:oligopeptide/dipeptide ABC transporter ATP-binding protein